MRVFKVRAFARFQRKERIADAALVRAVRDIEAGLIDADLGQGLIKQRVARAGQGKSRGFRTIIAVRKQDRAVFLLGYAKSDKADLDPDEHAELARRGEVWLKAQWRVIETAIAEERLAEIELDDEGEAEG